MVCSKFARPSKEQPPSRKKGNWQGKKLQKGRKRPAPAPRNSPGRTGRPENKNKKAGAKGGAREKSGRDVYSLHNLFVPHKLW